MAQQEQWDLEAERDIIHDACVRSFYWFLHEAWGLSYNSALQKWYDPEVHDEIVQWWQERIDEWFAARRDNKLEQKHLAVLLPREWLKSGIITQAGQCWLHVRDTELATYTGSVDVDLAAELLGPIKKVISGEDPNARFTWLFGIWRDDNRTWREGEVVHAARRNVTRHEPSFGTWGVSTGFVGVHADALFFDDPISYDRLERDADWMEKVVSHVASLGPVLTVDGLAVWPGTRYGDGDHFGQYVVREKVKTCFGHPLPIDFEMDKKNGVWDLLYYSGRDPDGFPSNPRVWPESRLVQDKARDPNKHAAQILNDPLQSGLNPLTPKDIAQCWAPKNLIPWPICQVAFHCDMAWKDPEKMNRGDYSVIVVAAHCRDGSGDVWFVESYGSNHWQAGDFFAAFQRLLQKYRMEKKRIFAVTHDLEGGGLKGGAELNFRNAAADIGLACPPIVPLSRGGTKKIGRIVRAASFWTAGHVKIVEGDAGNVALSKQMGRILASKRKDYMDAASDAFAPGVYMPQLQGMREVPTHLERPGDEILQGRRSHILLDDDESFDPPYEHIEF